MFIDKVTNKVNKSVDKTVLKTISKAKEYLSKGGLSLVLSANKYEKLVPYNLWYNHELYQITNYTQNNQNMRIRFYNEIMLSPIVSYNEHDLSKIKTLVPNMSLYQPFYPETFYSVWEFLQSEYINQNAMNFLFIGKENKLGSVESLMIYNELYKNNYLNNTYTVWISDNESHDIFSNSYLLKLPKHNYLKQAFKINFLTNTNQLNVYDTIIIDAISQFDDIFDWSKEETDLHANLFYLFTSLKHLKKNTGSILFKFSMMSSQSWFYLFDILFGCFKEYEFFRPKCINPFNSEIYLYLNKFTGNIPKNNILNSILTNLYRQNVTKLFHLNLHHIDINPIFQKYLISRNKWINNIIDYIDESPQQNNVCYVTKWHNKNNLLQIKDTINYLNQNNDKYKLSNNSHPKIKSISHNFLLDNNHFKNLLQKRASLNFYKRVMDTRPSRIFLDMSMVHDFSNEYYVTWDYITGTLDFYKNIKIDLKKQYNGEMITTAWIKLYEILNEFPDIIPKKELVKSFHLCEAPGAFVSATHHYMYSLGCELDWYAQTLNPMYENKALDDHYGLMSLYPDKWLFGSKNNNTGDITSSEIIKSYASNKQLSNIDFMTGDAGIYCRPNCLNEQETVMAKINMGQIVCILACLSKGRSAVFKTFLPLTEPLNISLLNLLSSIFEELIFYKPGASNGSNSEIYIVLKSYKGISSSELEMLYLMLDDPKITSTSFITDVICKNFFRSYIKIVSNLIDKQINCLQRNFYYYYNIGELYDFKKNNICSEYYDEWFNKNKVVYLENTLFS